MTLRKTIKNWQFYLRYQKWRLIYLRLLLDALQIELSSLLNN